VKACNSTNLKVMMYSHKKIPYTHVKAHTEYNNVTNKTKCVLKKQGVLIELLKSYPNNFFSKSK
jgi:hypothetical protein